MYFDEKGEELESLINKIPLVSESMVYGKKKSKSSKDVIVAVRVTLDNEEITYRFGNNVPSDEEIYKITYSKLKPGSYVFKIAILDGIDGKVVEAASYKIEKEM